MKRIAASFVKMYMCTFFRMCFSLDAKNYACFMYI